MAKITPDNIESLRIGNIIYKFPASSGKPANDFLNSEFYYINRIIRQDLGEYADFELLVVVPPIIPIPTITFMQTTKSYGELVAGNWYTYEIKIGN